MLTDILATEGLMPRKTPSAEEIRKIDIIFFQVEKYLSGFYGQILPEKRQYCFTDLRFQGMDAGYVIHRHGIDDYYMIDKTDHLYKYALHEATHRIQIACMLEHSDLSHRQIVEYTADCPCIQGLPVHEKAIASVIPEILSEVMAYYTTRLHGDNALFEPCQYLETLRVTDVSDFHNFLGAIYGLALCGVQIEGQQTNIIGDYISMHLIQKNIQPDTLMDILARIDITDQSHPLHDPRDRYIELCRLAFA